jgi:hypothetical protein
MRNFMLFGLFVLLLISVQFASAQTVDEIVEKYVDAMGGKDKLLTLKSVKMDGSMNVQGNDVSIITTKLQNVGVRMDIKIMDKENYQIYTPTKGWSFMPIQGQETPQEIPEEILKGAQSQLDIQGVLFNYKEKGHKVELAGKESVNGTECFKLKITYKNGNTANYFIDTKTFRINQVSMMREIQGEEKEVSNVYSNYKQNDGGYWFPFTATNMQGEITYTKIETNITIDESIFTAK